MDALYLYGPEITHVQTAEQYASFNWVFILGLGPVFGSSFAKKVVVTMERAIMADTTPQDNVYSCLNRQSGSNTYILNTKWVLSLG